MWYEWYEWEHFYYISLFLDFQLNRYSYFFLINKTNPSKSFQILKRTEPLPLERSLINYNTRINIYEKHSILPIERNIEKSCTNIVEPILNSPAHSIKLKANYQTTCPKIPSMNQITIINIFIKVLVKNSLLILMKVMTILKIRILKKTF